MNNSVVVLRKLSRNYLARTGLAGAAALALISSTPSQTDYQDIVDFVGKKQISDRWLASLVAEPERYVHDPDDEADIKPIILNEDGARLSRRDFGLSGTFKGYVFAANPDIAAKVSQKTYVKRDGKGDRPVSKLHPTVPEISTGTVFKQSAFFSAPSEQSWPTAKLFDRERALQEVRTQLAKADENKKAAQKKSLKTASIPRDALSAIETAAEAQVTAEIKDGTITSSKENQATIRNAYANVSAANDPRSVFETVLKREEGAARLPEPPTGNLQELARINPELPLDATIDEDVALPVPAIKPKRVARLALNVPVPRERAKKARKKKKQHFWASYELPGTVYRKSQQRCLATAIYFEARGESEKGQAAVAQVVLNRVKAPAYPRTICGVVYQNKHKRNRCQFSFACDGYRDRVKDKIAWKKAVRIASDVSKGRVYLDKVADSTHYHATYVKPRWRRNMKVVDRIGVHIFYRTRNGGWS